MNLSINEINRKMLTRYIDQLRYENKVLSARLMECSKGAGKEDEDEEDNGENNQPPNEEEEDNCEDALAPGVGVYDEVFPDTDIWFDIGSWKYMIKKISENNKYLRIMIRDTNITEMPEDLPFHTITDKNGTTLNVTRMDYMFNNCSNLTGIDLCKFDTSRVTNMKYMFYGCSNLAFINLSSFDTSHVTDMSYMFHGCTKLEYVELRSFNTSVVENMSYMFYGCTNLTALNNSPSFDTSAVTNMSHMFNNCSNLTGIDLHSFNTSKVMDMSYMFYGCTGLTDIDLSSFDTSLVYINMRDMLEGCINLGSIELSYKASKILTVFPGNITEWYANDTQLTNTTWNDEDWGTTEPVTFTRTIST